MGSLPRFSRQEVRKFAKLSGWCAVSHGKQREYRSTGCKEFPLYKDGNDRDPKLPRHHVAGQGLQPRAERGRLGIVEDQGGFRLEDQTFTLTEVLRARTDRTAFIDVKKAYDTVWR